MNKGNNKGPRVAVIGAGFSGLRCAEILGKNGARVTIFEAKDRVGGRVAQSEIGGHLIDLGPNWIHGTQNNPITTIAHETGTHMQDFESTPLVLSRDGYRLDDNVAAKVLEFMWTTVEEAFKYSNTHKDSIPAERSLLDFFQERVERTGFSAEEKEECLELCRLWGSYIGDGVERQSLRFFGLEECLDESVFYFPPLSLVVVGMDSLTAAGTCFVSSTYQRILEYISNAALRHAEIRYNQPVVRIEAQPRTTDHQHQVTLSTANGQTHGFDEVVVTCPLGWLKRNKSAFVPELPPRLSQAIDNISYGRLEKIYVTFPQAFWQDPTPPPPPNTAAATTTTTTTTTTSTHNDLTFVLFQNPTYTGHPQDPTIHWNQECLALTTLPSALAHPTLLFYIYGPCSEHITTTITTDTTTSTTTDKTLDTFLHPFYSRLPGYTATSPTCQPLAYHATTWQADPYAGHGSYTNFQTGLQHGDRDIETLRDADGLGARRGVWFAGEHTAPFVALGTTTGAFWSGERVAAEVAGVYGLGRRSASASGELV